MKGSAATLATLLRVKEVLNRALVTAEQFGDAVSQLECLRGLSEYELWTGDSRAAMSVAERIRALDAKGEAGAAGDADAQDGSALSWLGALGMAAPPRGDRPAARHRRHGLRRGPLRL